MIEFHVYYEDNQFRDSWVAWNNVKNGYIATPDTQKEALKKARGEAQQYANRHKTVAKLEVYQRNGGHKKTERIEPTESNQGFLY